MKTQVKSEAKPDNQKGRPFIAKNENVFASPGVKKSEKLMKAHSEKIE